MFEKFMEGKEGAGGLLRPWLRPTAPDTRDGRVEDPSEQATSAPNGSEF